MMSAKTRPISRPTALPSRWSTRATRPPLYNLLNAKAVHARLKKMSEL
jgi:hypothetical protein